MRGISTSIRIRSGAVRAEAGHGLTPSFGLDARPGPTCASISSISRRITGSSSATSTRPRLGRRGWHVRFPSQGWLEPAADGLELVPYRSAWKRRLRWCRCGRGVPGPCTGRPGVGADVGAGWTSGCARPAHLPVSRPWRSRWRRVLQLLRGVVDIGGDHLLHQGVAALARQARMFSSAWRLMTSRWITSRDAGGRRGGSSSWCTVAASGSADPAPDHGGQLLLGEGLRSGSRPCRRPGRLRGRPAARWR
jgi:hypothetical protein